MQDSQKTVNMPYIGNLNKSCRLIPLWVTQTLG